MTQEQLSKIQGFTVFNNFGSIEWLGDTDIRGIKLNDKVIILQDQAEVYPDDVYNEKNKPKVGKELNKPAVISFFNINIKRSSNYEKIYKKMLKLAEEQGFEMLEFNPEERLYKIKVQHFTKYNFADSDDEEEEVKKPEP